MNEIPLNMNEIPLDSPSHSPSHSPTSSESRSSLPPPPTPEHEDNHDPDGLIQSYLDNLNRIASPINGDSTQRLTLHLARADALLQQFQQNFNELIVCDLLFFLVYLIFFFVHPVAFVAIVFHTPHVARAGIGFKGR